MAIYQYIHPEELWYSSKGKDTIIKQGDIVSQTDLEYLLRTNASRLICIEPDKPRSSPTPNKDLSELTKLVVDQSEQIKKLIESVNSSEKSVTYVTTRSGLPEDHQDSIIEMEEPDFRPSIREINVDNITVVGDTKESFIQSENDLSEKLSKLAKFRNKK